MEKKQKKKGRKKYLLEFLMLFLAVFLGFLADSYREKLNDNSREKDYIQSLISDVNTDRENINYAIKHSEKRIKELDSLKMIASNLQRNPKQLKEFYYFFLLSQDPVYTVKPIERTITQLKSTGEMRLIRKKSSLNEILNYETQKEGLLGQSQVYENYAQRLADNGFRIFNTDKFQYFIEHKNDWRKNNSGDFSLLTADKTKILEFSNIVFINGSILSYYVTVLKDTDKEAEKLLEILKSDYNLK